MWVIPIILLVFSSILFIYAKPISLTANQRFGIHASRPTQFIIEALGCLLFLSALLINIIIWKTESAFILTLTLFGPCIFFAIINRADQQP